MRDEFTDFDRAVIQKVPSPAGSGYTSPKTGASSSRAGTGPSPLGFGAILGMVNGISHYDDSIREVSLLGADDSVPGTGDHMNNGHAKDRDSDDPDAYGEDPIVTAALALGSPNAKPTPNGMPKSTPAVNPAIAAAKARFEQIAATKAAAAKAAQEDRVKAVLAGLAKNRRPSVKPPTDDDESSNTTATPGGGLATTPGYEEREARPMW